MHICIYNMICVCVYIYIYINIRYTQAVSKQMQPINMLMIYYRDKCNGGHLEQVL